VEGKTDWTRKRKGEKMGTKKEIAVKKFLEGYNCAQ
jgi:hypothetical protein